MAAAAAPGAALRADVAAVRALVASARGGVGASRFARSLCTPPPPPAGPPAPPLPPLRVPLARAAGGDWADGAATAAADRGPTPLNARAGRGRGGGQRLAGRGPRAVTPPPPPGSPGGAAPTTAAAAVTAAAAAAAGESGGAAAADGVGGTPAGGVAWGNDALAAGASACAFAPSAASTLAVAHARRAGVYRGARGPCAASSAPPRARVSSAGTTRRAGGGGGGHRGTAAAARAAAVGAPGWTPARVALLRAAARVVSRADSRRLAQFVPGVTCRGDAAYVGRPGGLAARRECRGETAPTCNLAALNRSLVGRTMQL